MKKKWRALLAVPLALFLLPYCGSIPIPGLPDGDGDGIPDIIDPCPTNPDPSCVPETPPAEPYDCDNPPALTGLIKARNAVPGEFIGVLKRGETATTARSVGMAARFGATVQTLSPSAVLIKYDLKAAKAKAMTSAGKKELQGLAAKALDLLASPDFAYIQQNGRKSIPPIFKGSALASLSWGLDRIDQRDLPRDGKFLPAGNGAGVHVYINDTGVSPHPDFGSRLSPDCFSTIVLRGCEDGHGHGTHVAGTIAGSTWGVAEEAIIHSSRFLDENGSGTDADAIRSLDWIAQNNPGARGVVNASWGGDPAPAVDDAVCKVIASGKAFVAAAGNESTDAYSSTPARIKQVLTVGAMDSSDKMAYFSNFGPGVDLFAPGVDIESAKPGGGSQTMSGTSMASPHVAGGAAVYLGLHPSATVAEVHAGLVSAGTPGKIGGLPADTANVLLFVGGASTPPDGSVPPKTPR